MRSLTKRHPPVVVCSRRVLIFVAQRCFNIAFREAQQTPAPLAFGFGQKIDRTTPPRSAHRRGWMSCLRIGPLGCRDHKCSAADQSTPHGGGGRVSSHTSHAQTLHRPGTQRERAWSPRRPRGPRRRGHSRRGSRRAICGSSSRSPLPPQPHRCVPYIPHYSSARWSPHSPPWQRESIALGSTDRPTD